jgi:HSP20 family protein
MSLVKYADGRGLINPFTDVFKSFFNDSFFSERMISQVPAVNVPVNKDHHHMEMATPGLKKEDFKVNLERNMLTITSQKQQEQTGGGKKYNKREYRCTSFVRSFTLPEVVNNMAVKAAYTDCVLCVDVPKQEAAKAASRQMEIK